jgi:hypothetical protein
MSPGAQAIAVERDGVKLGWNTLAVLATIGLGLYITSIVSPILTEQKAHASRIKAVEKGLIENNRIDNDVHDSYHVFIAGQTSTNVQVSKDILSIQAKLK